MCFFSLFQGGIFSFHHNFSVPCFSVVVASSFSAEPAERWVKKRWPASWSIPKFPRKNGERFHQHLVVTDFFCHCFSDFFWKGATSPSDFCKNKIKNQGFLTQVWRMSTNPSWKGQTSPYPLKRKQKTRTTWTFEVQEYLS